MATRHQVRETIVGLLYAQDVGNENISKFLEEIFEEKKIRNNQLEFALILYNGVLNNLKVIDETINKHLKEWELDRVGKIERAILRLGAYEILFSDTDTAVSINEAIELGKKLGNESSPKFLNGVLDSLKKNKI